ncbi:MAG: hypothetical protein ACN6PJ_29720 [Achromobacter sp.]|uniref:hypothetical protein n=1 Tax=Achromobacter sp. TaxID=134375 RepID=UPI003D071E06
MSKRNHQVQTPGETPATAPEGDQTGTETQTTEAPQADATPAEKPAEQTKAAKKPAERQPYSQMHAADIDPDTLTAPVLSRDGWVIPTPKPAAKA